MDFVDLDKVLDEFEEEEKAALSIVPGQELKPSGYVEFLEKHEQEDKLKLNDNKFPSSSGYTLERNSINKEAKGVSYDEPYDSFGHSKLGLIPDYHSNFTNPAINQILKGQNTLLNSKLNDLETDKSHTSVVIGSTVSSDSEIQICSSQFLESSVVVEKLADDEPGTQIPINHEVDTNNSPVYASLDRDIPSNQKLDSIDGKRISSLDTKHETDSEQAEFIQNEQDSFKQPTVGFEETINDELEDEDVDIYLNELNGDSIEDFSLGLNVEEPVSVSVESSRTKRSLADELEEVNSCTSPKFSLPSQESHQPMSPHGYNVQTQFHTDRSTDSVSDSNGYPKTVTETLTIQDNDNPHDVYSSLLKKKTEIELILDKKRDTYASSDTYNSLLRQKLEIENVLDEKNSNPDSLSGVYEKILSGKMEIEIILDDVLKRSEIVTNESIATKQIDSQTMLVNEYNTSQTGIGARPKDPSALKRNKAMSMIGLSKTNNGPDLSSVVKPIENNLSSHEQSPESNPSPSCFDRDSSLGIATLSNGFSDRLVEDQRQRMDPYLPRGDGVPDHAHDRLSSSDGEVEHCLGDPEQDANYDESHHRNKRPTTLNLPSLPGIPLAQALPEQDASSLDESSSQLNHGVAGDEANAATISDGTTLPNGAENEQPPDYNQSELGLVAPFWIPDADALACMICGVRFTVWKRRHHCRACGKVLCDACSNQRANLPYMEGKEARVCSECHYVLTTNSPGSAYRKPNPNNPNEYCSKIPPQQQAIANAVAPVVMVPTGVLKTSGSHRRSGEPKQVMFSDGIRPGGDLTELDGPDQSRSQRRLARAARKAAQMTQSPTSKHKESSMLRCSSLLPETGLPPLYVTQGPTGYIERDDALNQIDYTEDYKSDVCPPICYAVNNNLSVGVKIVTLDCCVNRQSWCFVTKGMATAGQSELVILLELTTEEMSSQTLVPPKDVLSHCQQVYEEALKGTTVEHMGHTIFSQNFLENKDHGGFLYIRPSFQCLSKIPLPEPPYLFAILLQKWEAPWAKVFPIRLMLRLGAEFRYYPCPLVGIRNRKPVFYEIGHTIMNLLADFRNFQYLLTQIAGATIHMEDKKTIISFPKNRYNDVMKVVRSSNEHVMALGSSFSLQADSHLVCIQNEDGSYQTQAINIQNKPRLVTGASFVVFNGALKTSSGYKAKSSIVEDGVMVQVLPEDMAALKQALKDMRDYSIQCGPADAVEPEEAVLVRWVENDKHFNMGVKSCIDGSSLEGVESMSVKSPIDYLGETLAIRWTSVYFLHREDSSSNHRDPVDLSRLAEEVAQAFCFAITKHLDDLKKEGQIKVGLRVNLSRDSVGYEVGSCGKQLPAPMMNNLDTFLVPIIHQVSEEGVIMELLFYVTN